jgi:replicative DNA helicase
MEFDEEKIELYIIKSLLESDVYIRNYGTKMSGELFSATNQDIVNGILAFYRKNGKAPPAKILEDIVLPKVCKNSKERIQKCSDVLDTVLAIKAHVEENAKFLQDETKKFIKTRNIMIAFGKCVELLNEHKHEEIVKTMEDSFRINFDESLGLDYFKDLESRMERCNISNEKISTGLPTLDKMIGGGYRRKALFVYAGPGNVGKSLVLNDAASTLALNGYNVIYFSLELAEDYISQRTDAKFAQVSMNEINVKPEDAIKKAIAKRDIMTQEGKKLGKLIYKDYSPNEISCNDIRAFLTTLEKKNDFKPDFIIIDYVKLLKASGKVYGDNLYGKLGTVCEEMRALGKEYNACVITASQTGRQSYNSSSIGMEDVADSIAISQTADVLITLARNTALNQDNLILLNLVKSRFSRNEGQFQAKIDYDYMKLVDVSETSLDFKRNEANNVQNSVMDKVKSSSSPSSQPKAENDFEGISI